MGLKWNFKQKNQQHINLLHNKKGIVKTAAITMVLLTGVSFNLAFASSNDDKEVEKIYHIYSGDTYVGAVSDKASIQKIIDEKESEVSKQYGDYELDASSNLSIIPEQVFSYETNDDETLGKLKEELVVEADAYGIIVNGKTVAYVKNEQDFEETLRLLKLQYISEEKLAQFEANKESTEQLPALENGETRVVDLTMEETVEGEKSKAVPSDILTPEKAVQFLKSGSLEKELYTVQEGDVLSTIANKNGLKTKELLALNSDLNEDSILQIGQQINITVEKPFVNVKKVYELKNEETIDFEKVVEYDDSMLKGEEKVIQEGAKGKKEVSYVVTELNGKEVEKTVTDEKILTEPKEYIVKVGTKVISSRGTGNFAWPTNGGYISSYMGPRWGTTHNGIDIARPSNYNIKASDNGVVTYADWGGSYGNKIVIDHNNGYETIYGHLSEIHVSVGQTVQQGSVIGIMGSTGNSTGTHLHFEVHKNGSLVNPLSLLN